MIVSFLSGTSRAFPNRIGQAFVVQMRRSESEVPKKANRHDVITFFND
jgi:hypothetical protein